jgi:DNA-binding transcriptional LysR family regulator
MARAVLNDLAAFEIVASLGSFTRAAAQLGVSPSALSHALRSLEERLGIRLLARTTRKVTVTEAGERLLRTLRPALLRIEEELAALTALREKPAGTVRITTVKHAYMTILRPVLSTFLAAYPDIHVEVTIDDGLSDIVADRYDAGIRFGGQVAKDMIAVRVGPDMQAAVVASPSYLAQHDAPKTPFDLSRHRCINYRLATAGGLYAWQFEKDGERLEVRVDGPLIFNDGDLILDAAFAGHGLAYVFMSHAEKHLADGTLVRLLADWCPPFSGYHLYHPSRRQTPPALAALIDTLRLHAR